MKTFTHSGNGSFLGAALRFAAAAFVLLAPLAGHSAGDGATAAITGRVFNVATGVYLANAEVRVAGTENYVFTGEDGGYVIIVPAGSVTLAASYAGSQAAAATLSVASGASLAHDFDLQPLLLTPDAAAAGADVVVLDRFDVTAERTGQAKAIMDQRAAVNAVTLVAADHFGDVTQGSLGEIVKFLPGITIDYSDGDAGGVRIGGLDTKYTTVSQDGTALSTTGRAVTLENLTSTGIESIEFVQTLTAGMDAGSAAGRLNLRTKDPFSRRNREIRFNFSLSGHSSALDWGGAIMPDGRKHDTIYPGGQLTYGDLFFKKRLAIEFNIARWASYSRLDRHIIMYSYWNPDPALNPGIDFDTANQNPAIAQLYWRPMPRLRDSWSGNLNIGYQIAPALKLTLRSGFQHVETEWFNLTTALRGYYSSGAIAHSPLVSVQPDSTHTYWNVKNTAGAQSRLINDYAHRLHNGFTKFLNPRLTYKRGPLTIDLAAGYSRYTGRQLDADRGFFYAANSFLTGLSWTATRPSADSPEWTLAQTGGDPWSAPENWNKTAIYPRGVRSYTIHNDNIQYSATLDLAYILNLLGHPFTIKAGGAFRDIDYDYRVTDHRYDYLGDTRNPHQAAFPYVANYTNDFSLGGKGGNFAAQKWRVDDTYALYRTYLAHPDWFGPATLDNYRRDLTGARALHEKVSAAYAEINTRYGRLRLNAGLRAEATDVETEYMRRRSNEEMAAAGLDESTIEGLSYRYHGGQRLTRDNDYSNIFLSGGAKYDITANLQAQLSASQSILRPDYANLSGVVVYDEDNEYVRIPNGSLKPEHLTKYYAGLNYKFEPAGVLSLTAYRIDIKDKQLPNVEISLEEAERIAGMPLESREQTAPGDGEENGAGDGEVSALYQYRTAINSNANLSSHALTLSYDQQLTFLPGLLRGASVFGNYTLGSIRGTRTDLEKVGQVKKSFSGGLRYRYARFHAVIRGNWQDSYLLAVTLPLNSRYRFLNDHEYLKPRLTIDISGGLRLNSKYELAFSVKNLTNTPFETYSNTPGRLRRYDVNGTTWNLSLKGAF